MVALMIDVERELEDDLAVCVACGLCLPHCPTFRVTSEEAHSPRGRLTLMKAVLGQEHRLTDIRPYLDTCVQCRSCETACPSGVEYGHILSSMKQQDARSGHRPTFVIRIFLGLVVRPRMLAGLGRAAVVIQRMPLLRSLISPRWRVSGVPIRQGHRIDRVDSDLSVWLFTGCVMNAWFREVHRSSIAVLTLGGETVSTPLTSSLCCGALHFHSGSVTSALQLMDEVMDSMPGDAPIVVNSAGCGAMLKEYGRILRTEKSRSFSARVLDIHEWIDENVESLKRHASGAVGPTEADPVVVQEPCHLLHAQRVSLSRVVEKFVPVVRLQDEGMCCGAGGAYSLIEPDMSRTIRDRKSEAIDLADPKRLHDVVTANPGCHVHLAAAGHRMRSSVGVIAASLGAGSDEGEELS